jgi:flavin reductase (DIM6/NTAB) family NADH-FMN oxidoreductase RutF
MPIDPTTFRNALARFASGVTIVTARDGDGRDVGMTVSAFSSLSLEPPLVLLCIDHNASVAPVLAHCEIFAVNILAEQQQALSRRFAEHEVDRFDGVPFKRGALGPALIDGAIAHLECRVHARHPGGDHTILIGVVDAAAIGDGNPLLYFRSDYGRYAK